MPGRILLILAIGAALTCCKNGDPALTGADAATSLVPTATDGAVEPAQMRGMVDAHNRVRAEVGVGPLAWSDSLAAFAQEWANELAASNGCQMQHRPPDGRFAQRYGENLYWAGPRITTTTTTTAGVVSRRETREMVSVSPENVALAWASEKPDYSYADNDCAPERMCGHYTQMVWNDTRRVGCAMARCADDGQIWVCNYDPPGNWVGRRPF